MSENILVVDDELSNRRIVEQVLSRAGYRVATADGGITALQQIDSFRPDLIVLAWMSYENYASAKTTLR
jgi:CheY-like chemotaxis protein